MKRTLVLLIMAVLLLGGCGGDAPSVETPLEQPIKVDENKDTVVMEADGVEVEVAKEEGVSVDLPEGYPKDIFPVYRKALVTGAVSYPDGSVGITFSSNDGVSEVAAFYEEILENAQVLTVQKDGDYYMNVGQLGNDGYSVMIEGLTDDEDGYACQVSLVVVMDQYEETEAEEEATGQGDMESTLPEISEVREQDLPQGYPMAILPPYPTGMVNVLESTPGFVIIYTWDDIANVQAHYETHMGGAEDYGLMNMGVMVMINGTMEDIFFNVSLMSSDGSFGEDESFETIIQITY